MAYTAVTSITIGGKQYGLPEMPFIVLELAWPAMSKLAKYREPERPLGAAISEEEAAGVMQRHAARLNIMLEVLAEDAKLMCPSVTFEQFKREATNSELFKVPATYNLLCQLSGLLSSGKSSGEAPPLNLEASSTETLAQ